MSNYIYGIKNLINNKVYIGSTKSIKTRKYEHFRQLAKGTHHSTHLQASYNKYGKDKFAFYIIEECTPELRRERELFHINSNKSFDRDFGYNIYEPNGDNFKCSDSTKIKLIEANLRIGRSSQVDIYLLDGTFVKSLTSIKMCAKEFSIPRSVIYDILSGKRKSYKGYTICKQGKVFAYKPSNKQRTMTKHYK